MANQHHSALTLTRRQSLLYLIGAGLSGWCDATHARVRNSANIRMAAAWRVADGSHEVGVLQLGRAQWQVSRRMTVPTRAHGGCVLPSGDVISVARRPGDWLMRWHPRHHATHMVLIETDRVFNGHALPSRDGLWLYTSETRLDTGAGLIGVRRADTLEKKAEWPTLGNDPHDLCWLPDTDTLVVANGGITTRPETGRQKLDLSNMDASLVFLHTMDKGQCAGQWRLPDPRLSIRHLGIHLPTMQPSSLLSAPTLGLALQAEHDNATVKQQAPVLALWHRGQLTLAEQPVSMAGYGGDIAPTHSGFAVSSPRAGVIGQWQHDGRWMGATMLAEAGPLASTPAGQIWCGGTHDTLLLPAGITTTSDTTSPSSNPTFPSSLQVDNHWRLLPA